MYRIDYENKIIYKDLNGKEFKKSIKNARDIIKYRIYSCKLLLSYLNQQDIDVNHFLPLDLHNYIKENKKLKINSDTKILKNYFILLLKNLINILPNFSNILNNKLNNNYKINQFYKEYDKIFINYTNLDPLFVGLALSLELNISTCYNKLLPYNTLKNIIENQQFNINITNNKIYYKFINQNNTNNEEEEEEQSIKEDDEKIQISKNYLENLFKLNNYLIERIYILENKN